LDLLQPVAQPWFTTDSGGYPSIYGRTEVSFVTFAIFGKTRCTRGKRDYAVAGHDPKSHTADAWHPLSLDHTERVDVEFESTIYLQSPNPDWLNDHDCIDMDCDGPKARKFS
jgi:hypothetical protein